MGDRQDNHKLLLRGARVVSPAVVKGNGEVLVEAGRIARVSESVKARDGARVFDLEGMTLMPGFIDLHNHGAVGVDTNDTDACGLRRVSSFLATRGVTAWLPTLVPAPDETYRRAAQSVAELLASQDTQPAAARALGLHYEGPFVNEHQCGALRTPYFLTYKGRADLERLASVPHEGAIHMTTLAPEVEGGVELIRELQARGWIVSIGHTRATLSVLERAREAGARHMTHFMNAMPQLHHREPGPVGWGLMHDDVTCDIIADGVHVNPHVLRLVLRCKTSERLALISDSVAPAGLGDGEYSLWGETISVGEGRTRNERGSIAGSVICMDDAARMFASVGASPEELARMASQTPARVLGIDGECGSIEEGKRADLVALDAQWRVRLTIIGGRVAFDAEERQK